MKEFIEIPFGAKDSELGGWEYTIPEGYTASIENGKIIVKKEESDDEKTRKEIIDTIHRAAGNSGVHISEFLENKYIVWLEKQGKNNMGISEATKQKLEDNLRKALEKETPESWNAFLDKQDEQKPTDEEMKILLQTEYENGKADAIEAAMESVTKDKESAIKFLKSAGIMDENGELAEEYRLERQDIDISSFPKEQQEFMRKYISLDKVTLIKLLAERDRNVEETTKSFENLDKNTSAWSEEDIRAIDRACVALRAYSNGELPNFLPSELLGYADKLQSLISQNR